MGNSTYDPEFSIEGSLPENVKNEVQSKVSEKLAEILGVEVDDVISEYVLVMVGNHKKLKDIRNDLVDFIGEDSSTSFIEWFCDVLSPYKLALDGEIPKKDDKIVTDESKKNTEEVSEQKSTSTPVSSTKENNETSKIAKSPVSSSDKNTTKSRVISLKGISKSRIDDKPIVSTNKGDLRSVINKNKEVKKDGDLRQLISKRRGKKPLEKKSGPAVNGQSASEMKDALAARAKRFGIIEKDSTQKPSKKRGIQKTNGNEDNESNGNISHEKKIRRGPNGTSKRQDKNEKDKSKEPKPPLPQWENPQMGFPRGMMPPYPYGVPPPGAFPPFEGGFYPPPFPYGGFPGYPPFRPPGPRGNFNKKWVNPSTSSSNTNAESTEKDAQSTKSDMHPRGTPRGPARGGRGGYSQYNYYSSRPPRPRFANKKWVRQPSNEEKDEALSASLPKTPPQEETSTE